MKHSQANHHSTGLGRGSAPSLPLSSTIINRLARLSRFVVRKARKLSPVIFLRAVLTCVASGKYTFEDLAFEAGLLSGHTLSRQGLWNRVGPAAVSFVKSVATEALQKSAQDSCGLRLDQLPGVKRILLSDSSVFTLHPRLAKHFPGASNQLKDLPKAQLRFQFTLEATRGDVLQARPDLYGRTDFSAAADILEVAQPGDLIIRDLGYASAEGFRKIGERGAFFLSRLPLTSCVFNASSGEQLDLLSLAEEHAPRPGDHFSLPILMTRKHKLPCRLIVIHEGRSVGDQRRRRLKEEGKRRGLQRRQSILELQDWTFLVTNVEAHAEAAGDLQLRNLYEVRWRIENLFKVAKSHTAIRKIAAHASNRHHIEMMIWSWILLMVQLGRWGLFAMTGDARKRSVFKIVQRVLQVLVERMHLRAARTLAELDRRFAAQLDYHSRYEKRCKRTTLPDKLQNTLAISSHLTLN